jgi:hypothetical protein
MTAAASDQPSLLATARDTYLFLPIAAAVAASAALAGTAQAAAIAAAFVLFALPGFLLLLPYSKTATRAFVFGAPLGYSLTSLLVVTVVALDGWNRQALVAWYVVAMILLATASYVTHRRLRRAALAVRDQTEESALPIIAGAALTLLVAVLFVPFATAGHVTPRGYAFTGLFGHDFILRALDSVALANGVPSDNYFFEGVKTYNYYVLWYMLPATLLNFLGSAAEIRPIVAVVSLLNVPVFGALLYYMTSAVIRRSTSRPINTARLGGIFAALLLACYSYHWIFFVVARIGTVAALPAVGQLMRQMGSVSTSWYKDLLFQPHSMLALSEAMVLLYLADLPLCRWRAIGVGLLLGSIFLTDTVIFLIVSPAFAVWLLSTRTAREYVSELPVIAVSALAVAGLAFALKIFIVPTYSNRILLAPYSTVIVTLPAFVMLVYGAMPVAAVADLFDRATAYVAERRFLLILLLVSVFYMLFVTEALEGNVFLRKALTVLRLAFFVLAARYLYVAPLTLIKKAIALLLLLGIPTLVTDVYATSTSTDPRDTTYVTPAEMAAATWIRTHTAPAAVVQSLIDYSGAFDYSLTICFGERRAALGLWKMAYQRYPNLDAITQRVHRVESVFASADSAERYRVARELHIDFVFVGPRERSRFPGTGDVFESDTMHFGKVYGLQDVAIYQVRAP